MPNLKKFIKDLRQDFVSYLQPFPNISSKIALSLATLTFSKTRFCSHINFIGRCLNFKVIPKGFRTNFHASNFSISCNRYFQDIDQACNTFSKNVMRATIKAMLIKRQEIDQKIQTNRSELKNVCPVILVNSIRLKIRDLNSKLFQYLQDHKNQKLFELTGRDPNSNSKPLEQRYNVVTIPEDLPLSEPEKSILGKGLNFVPLTKKTDEFTVKEDTEKFLRRVKLKAHFHDKEQPSDEPQRDEFESLKPKKSNWTPPDGQFTSVDLFVKKCRVDIQKLNLNKSLKFSNLSKEEWTAHQNLKTRDDIVIKPADITKITEITIEIKYDSPIVVILF